MLNFSEYLERRSPCLFQALTNTIFYCRRLAQYAISFKQEPKPSSEFIKLFNDRCDKAMGQLALKSDFIPFTSDTPSVICLAHNEEYRIAAFIQHYLELGAKSIHVIDNESSDRTVEIAAKFPCVTIWSARGSYLDAEYGNLWRGALSRHYGIGKWVLNLDADEFIQYSHMEGKGLGDLQAWLEKRGQSSVAMAVIDMYPLTFDQSDVSHAQSARTLCSLLEESPYFDRPIRRVGSTCWIQKNHRGMELKGGVRLRMMRHLALNESPWLNVFPLIKWNDQTAYYAGSRHHIVPYEPNRELFLAVLLHFKFVGNFHRKIKEAIQQNQYWDNSKEYRRYDAWLEKKPMSALFDEMYSVKFSGYQSLLDKGLMQPLKWS